MSRTDAFNDLLARLTIPGPPSDASEAATIAAFDERCRRYAADCDTLMAQSRRSPFDFRSPAADQQRIIDHIEAWLGYCRSLSGTASALATAGRPAFGEQVDAAIADATKTLAVMGIVVTNSVAGKAAVDQIAGVARRDALTTLTRLSEELATETDPLNTAGRRRRH